MLNLVNVVTLYAVIFELHHYGVVLEFASHGPLDEFIKKYQARVGLLFHFTNDVVDSSTTTLLYLRGTVWGPPPPPPATGTLYTMY